MIKCKQAMESSACGKACCCLECEERESCKDVCTELSTDCEDAFNEETALQEFRNTQLATLNAIASLTAHKKAIEDQEKQMKATLYEAMVKFGVDKFESAVLNLTLVKPTTTTTIDSAKLKKKYPDVAAECSKTSTKAGYVKINLKGGEAVARDEFWDALKDHAKKNHQERVAKNPDRIAYAIQQFEAHGIEYQLKNEQTGHFHCWRKSDDKLFQFYAGTGKIQEFSRVRGVHNLIKMLEE